MFNDLGVKGFPQRGRGRGCGFDDRREGVAVWRSLVRKHVGEEDKRLVGLSKTEIRSRQSVVEESAHPFQTCIGSVWVIEKVTFGD